MVKVVSTIAVDFDGTIHDAKHPAEGRRMGPPMDGAREHIAKLRRKGHKIIVHSVRANNAAGMRSIVDWLSYFKIAVDGIEPKLAADWYVDDRAIRHFDWPSTYSVVKA